MKTNVYKILFWIVIGGILFVIGLKHYVGKKVQQEEIIEEEYFYTQYDDTSVIINNVLYDKSKKTINTLACELIVDSIDWLYNDENAVIMPFSRNQKRGFIDTQKGVVIITPKYDHAWVFRENLAAVVLEQRLFYIDKNDNVIIDGFDYVEYKDYYFEHGVAMAGKDTLVGLIDTTGQWVINPNYTYILGKKDSEILRAFSLDHTIKEFSTKGTIVNPCVFSRVIFNKINNPNIVVYEADWGWYGLMDIHGNVLTKPLYRNFVSIESLGENILYLSNNDRWGIMNTRGVIITKDIFEDYVFY